MKPNMYFQLLFLIGTGLLTYYGLVVGRQGRIPPIRRIAGLDALEEAVGRAAEMNKPVYITPGGGQLGDDGAIQSLAGLSIMQHTVKLCARIEAPFWVSARDPQMIAIAGEMVREALAEEGKSDTFREDTVEFFSDQQMAYAMGSLSRMERDGAAAAVLVGFFQAESLLLAEGASQQGAITIGGVARTSQIPFFVVACDYVLIGEEMLVGGAYLSKDPIKLSGLWIQDLLKVTGAILLLLGVVLNAAKIDILRRLFAW